MQSKVNEEIEYITDRMKRIDGVIGVILFGSYSRGDFEEGSDIDILAIFKDQKKLNDHLRDIYKMTSEGSLFIQVIGLTLEELTSSPLLQSVMREGKVYYAGEDVRRALTPMHRPYALITYRTTNLSPKERVVFAQELEGRGKGRYKYVGFIQKLDGFKVGRGVLMVPLENLKTLTEYLEKGKMNYVVRYIWA